MDNLQKIYIASYNFPILQKIHCLSQEANVSYQLGLITENVYSLDLFKTMIQTIDMKFVSFYWEILDNEVIDFFHDQKLKVFTYTCKDPQIYQFIEKFKIDGIVSNIIIPQNMKKM
jgi:glycerophosphoryl diester phosphodiesterase